MSEKERGEKRGRERFSTQRLLFFINAFEQIKLALLLDGGYVKV